MSSTEVTVVERAAVVSVARVTSPLLLKPFVKCKMSESFWEEDEEVPFTLGSPDFRSEALPMLEERFLMEERDSLAWGDLGVPLVLPEGPVEGPLPCCLAFTLTQALSHC